MKRLRNTLLIASLVAIVGTGLVLSVKGRAQYEQSAKMQGEKTIYTCSMHPNIVQDEPGTCPICGMKLDTSTDKRARPDQNQDAASDADKAGGKAGKKKRKIKHWVAPMDPTFVSDKPGKSPMGMDLVPVYEDDGGGSTIKIDPTVVQNMGVRIKRVEQGTIFRHVRTIGTVDVAENEISVVNLRFSGWVERIHVDETGVKVEKGQALFDIYSPDPEPENMHTQSASRICQPRTGAQARHVCHGAD